MTHILAGKKKWKTNETEHREKEEGRRNIREREREREREGERERKVRRERKRVGIERERKKEKKENRESLMIRNQYVSLDLCTNSWKKVSTWILIFRGNVYDEKKLH